MFHNEGSYVIEFPQKPYDLAIIKKSNKAVECPNCYITEDFDPISQPPLYMPRDS